MDEKLQILLGSCKNVNSVDVDNFQKIELENKPAPILEYDIRNALSATEIFDAEREANEDYRIYGRIEYLSLLNGLKATYSELKDFFLPNPQNSNNMDIFKSFDFYLLKAGTGYTRTTGGTITVVGINSTNYLINETFNSWVTASPTNYPTGWICSVGPGSYMQQTVEYHAKFVLGNQFINLISLIKEIPLSYGTFTMETNISSVSPSFDPAVDGVSVLFYQNGTFIKSYQLLADGIGYKKIEFTLPEVSGITKVGIIVGSNSKSITMDYFKLYQSGSSDGSSTNSLKGYVRYFDVITELRDFEIYNAGFSNNVYGDQVYSFNFNKDFNVSPYVDEFGFPATELFLYAQYKFNHLDESLLRTSWGTTGIPETVAFNPVRLHVGDRVYGDLIEYSKYNFLQFQSSPQIYYINTPYNNGVLQWMYNPIIPFRLRYFYDNLNSVNTGSTSYERQSTIPYYATSLGDGNFIWRDIIPQGNIDPLTGLGVDYPFMNKKRYLFSSVILDVRPNLSDSQTFHAFSEIKYGAPTIINSNPISDLNNIGKPCL